MQSECPGKAACHGCVSWCDLCGDVGHVCDDPMCDTHRREADVLRDIEREKKEMTDTAAKVRDLEQSILAGNRDVDLRVRVRAMCSRFQDCEKQIEELEEELQSVQRASRTLAPRPARVRPDPRQLELPFR